MMERVDIRFLLGRRGPRLEASLSKAYIEVHSLVLAVKIPGNR
jgi:hypothetical protein